MERKTGFRLARIAPDHLRWTGQLSHIADRARQLSVTARGELRAAEANPVLDKIEMYLAELATSVPPKIAFAKVVAYARNPWDALWCLRTAALPTTIPNSRRHGRETELYGYALHVEVTGAKGGQAVRHVLTHTHPASDGSVQDWAGLRAYTRCAGIPVSIGAQLIAAGKARGTGTVAPELAFDAGEVFAQLEKRRIIVHHQVFPPTGEP